MNLPQWFRRSRPTPPPPPVNPADVMIAYYWGYTMAEWDRLPDTRRTYCRENVTSADRFAS